MPVMLIRIFIGKCDRHTDKNPYWYEYPADKTIVPIIGFPPAPNKGMVKSSRKGHFQCAGTSKGHY